MSFNVSRWTLNTFPSFIWICVQSIDFELRICHRHKSVKWISRYVLFWILNIVQSVHKLKFSFSIWIHFTFRISLCDVYRVHSAQCAVRTSSFYIFLWESNVNYVIRIWSNNLLESYEQCIQFRIRVVQFDFIHFFSLLFAHCSMIWWEFLFHLEPFRLRFSSFSLPEIQSFSGSFGIFGLGL